MQIEVNDDFKFVSVWLTNEEKADQKLRESLVPMMELYKPKKYKFVVFESGKEDLLELTKDLLRHNKNLALAGREC